MIIGQFCDVYPPETDGVGMVVKNYAEELKKLKQCCYYISPRTPNCDVVQDFPSYQYMSIKLIRGVYRAGVPLLDVPFRRTMKSINFDIIHAHSPFSAGHEALRIAKKQKIPLVATFHTKYYDDLYIKTHSKLLSKTGVKIILDFYNSCDEVWAVNNATGDVLREYGYKKKIRIMPNGTNIWKNDMDASDTVSEKFGLGDRTVFLFVGQQDWKKNIRHIIEAIKIYSITSSEFKMVFTGQGPNEASIKQFAAETGLADKFIFTGHISDRNLLMNLYARADLFVFPSLYDNAPMVVREAASVGTPSILIKNSCAAEGITHEYNGFLCEDTPESIAVCIKDALPIAKQVGKTARETIPIPWSNIMLEVLECYQTLAVK